MIIFLIRYAVNIKYNVDTYKEPTDLYKNFIGNFNNTIGYNLSEGTVFYYPNNTLIKDIVTDGMAILTDKFSQFKPTSMFEIYKLFETLTTFSLSIFSCSS